MKVASKIERLIDAGAVVVWKSVPGYEGRYEVSNEGDVRSVPRKEWQNVQVLKLWNNGYGYLRVDLCKGGKRKHHSVHKLVMSAFVGPCPKGMEVNHIDENPQNNNLNNLEYITHKQNANHGTRNTRIASERKNNPKICIPIESFDLKTGKTIKKYPSANEAKRCEGYSQGAISLCINGYIKSYKGVGWRRSTST